MQFSNHLFCKLGLIVASYALSHTYLPPIDAKEAALSRNASKLTNFWAIDGQSSSTEFLSENDQEFYDSLNEFDNSFPLSEQNQEPIIHWDDDFVEGAQEDFSNPQVLFSFDSPAEPATNTYPTVQANTSEGDFPDSFNSWAKQEESQNYPFEMPISTSSDDLNSLLLSPKLEAFEENNTSSSSKEQFPEVSYPRALTNDPLPPPSRQKIAPYEPAEEASEPLDLGLSSQIYSLEPSPTANPIKAWIEEPLIADPFTEEPFISQEEAPPPIQPQVQEPQVQEPQVQEPQVQQPQVQQPQEKVEQNNEEKPTKEQLPKAASTESKSILINFNNVGIIEYIRFISRISNKNFVFDEADLQFNVTIVSEEPTSIENVMAALIQELRIHDLILTEQGNNLIIHKNPKVSNVSQVIAEDLYDSEPIKTEIVTQVFRLNTLEPERAAAIIRPLVSDKALVETLPQTNHLIVTDILTNIQQISKLIKSIDAPNSGLVIGQYVARTTDVDTLLPLVQKIMIPISQDQPLSLIPYAQANSIFIVSTPFLVERSISILQHLDQEAGKTGIINLGQPKHEQGKPGAPEIEKYLEELREEKPSGKFPQSAWDYGPGNTEQTGGFGTPDWLKRMGGNYVPIFIPLEETQEQKEARERAIRVPSPTQVGVTDFQEAERLRRNVPTNYEYVPLPILRSKFYIHKLQYRKGDAIQTQLQQIGKSLLNVRGNEELLSVIDTVQWLEDAKSLVFTGTPEYLEKVKQLIEEIDIPLRQVFIEMLILTTTVDDSLNFSVNWGSRFGGGNQAGSQGFLTGASPLQGTLDTTGVSDLGGIRPNPPTAIPFNNVLIPSPNTLAKAQGFSLGVIGQNIVHKGLGLQFNSIGALVKAIHTRNESRIVMTPKIITEDNVPAYIFVGINTPFQTQSIANDRGSVITNNFDYRDVGTSLQVTPHLVNSDVVTLDIVQEVSSISTVTTSSQNSNQPIAPTTNKNTTKTTVLIPDGYFVIISGMMQDETIRNRIQVPCLGCIPLAGSAFSDKETQDNKRNLMIFIRPQIIDTDEEYQNATRHQQDIWKFRDETPKIWVQETEQALDFLNVRRSINTDDEDNIPCDQFAH